MANDAGGTDFNGNIILNNTANGGIRFGQQWNCLAGFRKTVSAGSSGYTGGDLYLRKFTQNGSSVNSLTATEQRLFIFKQEQLSRER